MIEIELTEKQAQETKISADLALARQIAILIKDNKERREVDTFLDALERHKEGELPIKPGDLSESKMDQGMVTDRQKQEYAEVLSALEIARKGGYMRSLEMVANIDERQGTRLLKAHSFALLAEIIDEAGIDATPVFILSMDHLRDFMNEADSLAVVEGVEITESVLKKALELGYFNIIRLSAERTMAEALKPEGMVDMYLLISIASFLGLSIKQQDL